MTKQFNIRSEKAYLLAMKHAQAKGKPLGAIVEEALELLDAQVVAEKAERVRKMREAIRAIQEMVRKHPSDFKIEDMYGEDGLPC